jgi:hypothetical protein
MPETDQDQIAVLEFRLHIQQAFFGLARLGGREKARETIRKAVLKFVDKGLTVISQTGEPVPSKDIPDLVDAALEEVQDTSSEVPPEA